tara:strand:- start:54869 stop:55102 length:234 start_codon:yes stop_codon:yes gene_type:complete
MLNAANAVLSIKALINKARIKIFLIICSSCFQAGNSLGEDDHTVIIFIAQSVGKSCRISDILTGLACKKIVFVEISP